MDSRETSEGGEVFILGPVDEDSTGEESDVSYIGIFAGRLKSYVRLPSLIFTRSDRVPRSSLCGQLTPII